MIWRPSWLGKVERKQFIMRGVSGSKEGARLGDRAGVGRESDDSIVRQRRAQLARGWSWVARKKPCGVGNPWKE